MVAGLIVPPGRTAAFTRTGPSPAISFFTCLRPFPQNEQNGSGFGSRGFMLESLREQRARAARHGSSKRELHPIANLYPNPYTVRMNAGFSGCVSIFFRSFTMKLSTVRFVGPASSPQIFCKISSRATGCPARS